MKAAIKREKSQTRLDFSELTEQREQSQTCLDYTEPRRRKTEGQREQALNEVSKIKD